MSWDIRGVAGRFWVLLLYADNTGTKYMERVQGVGSHVQCYAAVLLVTHDTNMSLTMS